MKKRMVSLVLMGVLSMSLFAGCGNDAQNSSTSSNKETSTSSSKDSSEEAKSEGEKQTIDVWYYWENEKHQEILNSELAKFNESQDAIEATAKYVPFADFKKQLSIGATASELPDIVIIDSPDHASYAEMGIFADISGKVDTSEYYEGPMASCTLNDTLYGIPFGSNCLGLYYNEDMLAAANIEVPETWDELKEAAKALTKDNVTGLAFCSLQNEEGTFNFLPWLWSTGTDSYNINNEQGIRALTFISELVKDGSMSKEAINWTQGDVMNQFISGNVAMMVNGPWQIPTMREEAPDLNWDVALIPKDEKFASDLGGENFAVINNENVDLSLEVINFLTSKEEVASYIDEFGYIASRKDVAENQFQDDPEMKKFIDQMDYALSRGPHAKWPEISDAISLAFNEAITETSTPEDAAAKAQQTIDSLIK